MRKVLLVPLLILVPLAGLQAYSTNGQTPGAAVLQGGLGDWALETVDAQNSPRDGGFSTARSPESGAAQLAPDEITSTKGALQPGATLTPGFPTCWIDSDGPRRDFNHLLIDEADLLDDPSSLPGIGEAGLQKLVAEASATTSGFRPDEKDIASGKD